MYKKYQPSIESSILSNNANYGDGKDVKFWRSKLRRINAKYLQELSALKNRVEKLEKGEKRYVEQLFPYYVKLLQNIKKLQKKLEDEKFVSMYDNYSYDGTSSNAQKNCVVNLNYDHQDYQSPKQQQQHAFLPPPSPLLVAENGNNYEFINHTLLPPPSSPPPMFEPPYNNNSNSASNINKSDNYGQQAEVRILLNSRKERQRLQNLKSLHPHPSKRTNYGQRNEKQINQKMYVKNKQKHLSIHELKKNHINKKKKRPQQHEGRNRNR